jgi:hypothetical protein
VPGTVDYLSGITKDIFIFSSYRHHQVMTIEAVPISWMMITDKELFGDRSISNLEAGCLDIKVPSLLPGQ